MCASRIKKAVTRDSDGVGLRLHPFDGSRNISVIDGRDNRITVASIESQEAVRGGDFSMAHLSEVAFWRSSSRRSPEDFIRAVCGSVHYGPDTLIVMESTANGTGNYFHREWLRTVKGESDKEGVFIPWYEIDIYMLPVDDVEKLWQSMDAYERGLWDKGLTLEQINWYHHKRREYPAHSQMMAEYPTTDMEAFVSSASGVFAMEHVTRMRRDVCEPLATGDVESFGVRGADALKGVRFVADSNGPLLVWEFPDTSPGGMVAQRYVERDARACDEFDQYERRCNGSFGARDGCHDDLLMTRALIIGVLDQRRVTPLNAVMRYNSRSMG